MKALCTILITLLITGMQTVRAANGGAPDEYAADQGGTTIITTYSAGYRWSDRIISHATSYLAAKKRGPVTSISLPLVSINTEQQLDSMVNVLHKSLLAAKPRRVILVGSAAFALCKNIDSWFHGISMLLVGGQDYTGTKHQLMTGRPMSRQDGVLVEELRKKYNVSFQYEPVFMEEEVEMICRIMPQLKTLYFIGGGDVFSRNRDAELRRYLAAKHPSLGYVPVIPGKFDLDSLVSTLSSLDPKTNAVLYFSWRNNSVYHSAPALMSHSIFLINTSSAPAFLMRENGWMDESQDILGGCFADQRLFFNGLDKALAKFADDVPARDIPEVKITAPIVKLNYRKLVALGINPQLAPRGTVFTNEPQNVLQRYKGTITTIGIVILLVVLLMMYYALRASRKAQKVQEKQLEAKSQELEAKQRMTDFIENVPMGYVQCQMVRDDNGRVIDLLPIRGNKLARKWYEGLGGQMDLTPISDKIPKATPVFMYKLNRCLELGTNVLRTDMYIPDFDRHLLVIAFFFKDNTIGLLARDHTELVKANMKLQATNTELKAAKEKAEISEKVKKDFLMNMTHEVRTPLNVICGFSEVISDPQIEPTLSYEEKAQVHEGIAQQTQYLLSLLNSVIEYSDILSGTMHFDKTDCPLNEIARLAMSQVEHTLQPGVKMNLETEVPDSYIVRSSRVHIQQVLVNILSNACKFTQNGTITLSVKKPDAKGFCRYVCTDTGCGVPQDKVDYIFKKFTKIDAFAQGAGLGLAMCRIIAEELHCKIYLDTTYTEGARFVFEVK